MDVATIKIDEEAAKVKYKEYAEAVKTRKGKEYNALRRAYHALSKGLKVIDIYKAFEDTGKEQDRPKLAIVRADAKQVYFTKRRNGAGRFSRHLPNNWSRHEVSSDIELPEETFTSWITEILPGSQYSRIKEPELMTNVPIIPAHITIPKNLEEYFILFEVSEWKRTATVRDPYLLHRLSDNAFVVLAGWDVTEVEAIVMRAG